MAHHVSKKLISYAQTLLKNPPCSVLSYQTLFRTPISHTCLSVSIEKILCRRVHTVPCPNRPVYIRASELIKPSSPTPDHLKSLKLSLIDQLQPPIYVSLVFFYEAANELTGLPTTTDHVQVSHHLKKSLSEALTLYYPLAGKFDPKNFAIDCNDRGAEFVEARVHARLRDVVDNQKLDQFQQYIPVNALGSVYMGQGTIFMAQVNFFDCGGIAIAASLAHNAGDGSSLVEFVNAWAAICRGENPKSAPQFGSFARHFPPKDLSKTNFTPSIVLANDKIISKRFLFDKEKIAALKQAAISESVNNPSRVEVVSAFIWKHFEEKMLQQAESDKKKLLVSHVVNIRSRASPSLELEHAFGNGLFTANTMLDNSYSGQTEIHELVTRLRKAIRNVDEEYIKENQGKDHIWIHLGAVCDQVIKGELEYILFSGLTRFSMYEADFGRGRPLWAWVCTTALKFNNLVMLTSTKSGDGIEAWINLLPENVEPLEKEFKLIGSSTN